MFGKACFRALFAILVFCLLASLAYSQSWIECNEDSIGKIIEAGGNRYVCTKDGEYKWVSAQAAGAGVLIALIAVATVILAILILKKRKYSPRKKLKKR